MSCRVGVGFLLASILVAVVPVNQGPAAEPLVPPPSTRELHVVSVHAGAGSTTTYQRGDASVRVDRPQKRVVLFLSSYSPVRWYISGLQHRAALPV